MSRVKSTQKEVQRGLRLHNFDSSKSVELEVCLINPRKLKSGGIS